LQVLAQVVWETRLTQPDDFGAVCLHLVPEGRGLQRFLNFLEMKLAGSCMSFKKQKAR